MVAEGRRLIGLVLHAVVVQAAAGVEDDLAEAIVEITLAGTGQMMLDEQRPGIREPLKHQIRL